MKRLLLCLVIVGLFAVLAVAHIPSGPHDAGRIKGKVVEDTTGNLVDNDVMQWDAASGEWQYNAVAGGSGSDTSVFLSEAIGTGTDVVKWDSDSLLFYETGDTLLKLWIIGDGTGDTTIFDAEAQFTYYYFVKQIIFSDVVEFLNEINLEGSTDDGFQQRIDTDDPSADRIFNFPDDAMAAGDVLVSDAANSLAYLALATTEILIGDGSGIPTAAALSGDVTMTNGGVVSIVSQVIVNDDIDTTGENFVFDGAYHITSAEADSQFMSKKYIDDQIGGTGSDTSLFLSEAVGTGSNTVFWDNDTLFIKIANDTIMTIKDNGLTTRLSSYDNTTGFLFVDKIDMEQNDIIRVNRLETDTLEGGNQSLLIVGGTISGIFIHEPIGSLRWTISDNRMTGETGSLIIVDTIIIDSDTLTLEHLPAYFVKLKVHNATGATLTQGTPVFISGATGDVPNADSARSDDSLQMPAVCILDEDIANGADGFGIFAGDFHMYNTSGPGWSVGDPLYVAPTGGLTSTQPVAPNLIQKIGEVTRVNVSQGEIYVFGAGRSNDLPHFARFDLDMNSKDIIGVDSLHADKYADGSIDLPDLAVNSVDSTKLVANSVGESELDLGSGAQQVGIEDMLSSDNWSTVYWNATVPVTLPLGASGQVLKSNGTASAPSWETDNTGGAADTSIVLADITDGDLILEWDGVDDDTLRIYDNTTGTQAVTIASNADDLLVLLLDTLKIPGNWKTLYSDGVGLMNELALGTSGDVLTSGGTAAAPTWETPTGGAPSFLDVYQYFSRVYFDTLPSDANDSIFVLYSDSSGATDTTNATLTTYAENLVGDSLTEYDALIGQITDDTTNFKTAYDSTSTWDNRGYPQATTTLLGIASFDGTDFSVASGAVTIDDDGHLHTSTSISGLDSTDLGANSVGESELDLGSGAQQVGIEDMISSDDWSLIYFGASGAFVSLPLGATDLILKSTGTASAPTWQADATGSGPWAVGGTAAGVDTTAIQVDADDDTTLVVTDDDAGAVTVSIGADQSSLTFGVAGGTTIIANELDLGGNDIIAVDSIDVENVIRMADFILNVNGTYATYSETDAATDGQFLAWQDDNTLTWETASGSGLWVQENNADTLYYYTSVAGDTLLWIYDNSTRTEFATSNSAGFSFQENIDMNVKAITNASLISLAKIQYRDLSIDIEIEGGTGGDIIIEEPAGSVRWTFKDNRMTGEANAAIVLDSLIGTADTILVEDPLKIKDFALYTAGNLFAQYDTTDTPTNGQFLRWNTGNTLDWGTAAGSGLTFFTEADDNDTSVFTATGPNTTVGFNDQLTMQGNDITGIGDLRVNTDAYLNSDGPDADAFLYFYEGSNTGRSFKWDNADGRFELNDKIWIIHSITAGGTITLSRATDATDQSFLTFNGEGGINQSYIGNRAASNDLIFGADEADRLVLKGTGIHELTGTLLASADIKVDGDVYLNRDGSSVTGTIYAFEANSETGASLVYDSVANDWTFSHDLDMGANDIIGIDSADIAKYTDGSIDSLDFNQVQIGQWFIDSIQSTALTWTEAHIFTSATLEIPNAATTAPTAEAQFIWDTGDDWLVTEDADGGNEIVVGMKNHIATRGIDNPDALVYDTVNIFYANADIYPAGIVITGWGFTRITTTSSTMELLEMSDGNTVVSSIETISTCTTEECVDDGSITDPNIAAGNYVMIDYNDVDESFFEFWITYYIPDN